ncbi:CsbD family protein [Stenotrophobium rhamnosiphilum]|uniref:CsbD family protein n=1 Tax=Stenotrophobium rhamnosiphilum TaxID=2029166 RepID=A0A2T5MGW0_9GAMM|nr:CsbD family protein [Stenotrophobium rhamnosiphilum]
MNQDTLKGQWKQLVGKAKTTWGKLTDDELLKIEGNAQRLTGLVQERYGATREEAEKQVKKFFDGVSDAFSNEQSRRDTRAADAASTPIIPPI